MQPHRARGSFCSTKCSGGSRYKALQFESYTVSQTKSADQSLSSLVKTTDVDLGPVDDDWFGKSRKDRNEKKNVEQERKVLATPVQQLSISKCHHSPSLFSPGRTTSVPWHLRRRKEVVSQRAPWGDSQDTPGVGFPSATDRSPTTPGMAAFTPNQATGRVLDLSETQQSQPRTSGFNPFTSWNPAGKFEATPASFTKQLFKTPSSLARTPGAKVVTPGLNQSTQQRLSISLGADLDDSNLSWTSSLATPPGSKRNKMGNGDGIQSDGEMRIGVMPKALRFTTDETNPNALQAVVDKGSDSLSQSLDHDTQPLQLLRMSSLEEEAMSEDTLDSDVLEGGNATDEDGDVTGIPHAHSHLPLAFSRSLLRREVNLGNHDAAEERYVSKSSEDVTLKNAGSKLTERVEERLQGVLNLVEERCIEQNNKQEPTSPKCETRQRNEDCMVDSQDCEIAMLTPMPNNKKSATISVEDTVHIADGVNIKSLSGDAVVIGSGNPCNKTSVTSSKIGGANEIPRSCEDAPIILDDDILEPRHKRTKSDYVPACEASTLTSVVKPANNMSNIEETLAFLLATPPQRRAKLARRVKARTVDDHSHVTSGKCATTVEVKSWPIEDQNVVNVTPSVGLVHAMALQDTSESTRHSPAYLTNIDSSLKTESQHGGVVEGLKFQHDTALGMPSESSTKPKQHGPGKTSREEPEISKLQEATASKMLRINCNPSIEEARIQLTPQKSISQSTNKNMRLNDNHKTIAVATPAEQQDDCFSQISPNYAEALCYAVDAASTDCKTPIQEVEERKKIPVMPVHVLSVSGSKNVPLYDLALDHHDFQDEMCETLEDKQKVSLVSVQSSKKQILYANQPKQEAMITKTPVLLANEQHTSPSRSQAPGSDADNTPDEATAIFRMEPKTLTRKFYYPSHAMDVLSTTPIPIDKKKLGSSSAPKLMAGTLHVIKEEDETASGSDTEVGQMTQVKQTSSSTPTNRSTGFVTFSSFIKSNDGKSASAISTSKSSQYCNNNCSPLYQTVTTSSTTSVTFKGMNSNLTSAKSVATHGTTNQTTPVTSKSTVPLNLRSRRKLGRPHLPHPKRLRTTLESRDFHRNPEMVEESHPVAESPNVQSRHVNNNWKQVSQLYTANESVSQDMCNIISPSKFTSCPMPVIGGFTSGFKTAANKDISVNETSLQKAKSMIADIYSQETKLTSGGNSSDAPECLGGTSLVKKHDRKSKTTRQGVSIAVSEKYTPQQPLSFTSKIDEAKCPPTVGFSSASGKAIQISSTAMKRAHRLIDEVDNEPSSLDAERKTCKEDNIQSSLVSKESVSSQNIAYKTCIPSMTPTAQMPTNVGFSSASGKAIPISAKAIQKAHQLISDIGYDVSASSSRNNITPLVGFSSASGKSIHVSDKAMEKAQSFMADIDLEVESPQVFSDSHKPDKRNYLRKDILKKDNVKTALSEDKDLFVGFQSASGKSIPISEDAIRKAKVFIEDGQQNIVSETMQPFLQDKKGTPSLNADHPTRIPKCSIPSLVQFSSERCNVTNVSDTSMQKVKSFVDDIEGTCNGSVPSTVQFASASGKAINIADTSMQKARCFMDDITGTSEMSVPSTSGKAISVSDVAIEKAHFFLSSVDSGNSTGDVMPFINHNSSDNVIVISNKSVPKGENKDSDVQVPTGAITVGRHQRTPRTQPILKQKKDYSKLPKGFRPFKPPARTNINTKMANVLQKETQSCKDKEQYSEDSKVVTHIFNHKLPTLRNVEVVNPKCSTPENTVSKTEVRDRFIDDGLSHSQAQREIQATEHMELMYAFMQAEDQSYTQDPDKIPGTLLLVVKDDIPKKKDSVHTKKMVSQCSKLENINSEVKHEQVDAQMKDDIAGIHADSIIKKLDLDLAIKAESFQSGNPDVIEPLLVDSQVSEFNTSLNQGFVQSQNTVFGEAEYADSMKMEEENTINSPKSAKLKTIEQQHQTTSHGKEECKDLQTAGERVFLSQESKHVSSECEHPQKGLNRPEGEKKNTSALNERLSISCTSTNKSQNPVCVHSESKNAVSGFQTGNGKCVTVSAQALKKAKNMLAAVEEGLVNTALNSNQVPFPGGFKTASGRRVVISAESLEQARSLISESDMPGRSIHTDRSLLPTDKVAVEVCTASESKVCVSDVDEIETIQRSKPLCDEQSVPIFTCLQAASGSKVQVLEESLQTAKKTLTNGTDSRIHTRSTSNKTHQYLKDKIEPSEEKRTSKVIPSLPNIKPEFVGFQTASGNKVLVSEDALQKARTFLKDDSANYEQCFKPSEAKGMRSEQKSVLTEDKQGCIGFQTANGSTIHVSDEALERDCHLLTKDANNATSADKYVGSHHLMAPVIQTSFDVFQTASGNKVSVSEKALEMAHNFLMEDADNAKPTTSEDEPVESVDLVQHVSGKGFVGFQTASGTRVNVSEKSLASARRLIAESDDTKLGYLDHTLQDRPQDPSGSDKRFVGFQTASGTRVNVSEKSLASARCLIAESDDTKLGYLDHTLQDRPQDPSGSDKRFVGFQTASGTRVNVSEKSLASARHLIAESDDTKLGYLDHTLQDRPQYPSGSDKRFVEPQDPSGSDKRFVGFQTASGSAVSVSKESLQKAKSFFAEENGSEVTQVLRPSKPPFFGFQTASGHEVDITEDSLKKAQEFLNQDNSDIEPIVLPHKKKGCDGFSTACGTMVEVSKESVNRSLIDNNTSTHLSVRGAQKTRIEPEHFLNTKSRRQNECRNSTSKGDCIVPEQRVLGEPISTIKHVGSSKTTAGNDLQQAKKQFVPYRRRQPVSSSPAGQWADRSSNVSTSCKSFKPYSTAPVVSISNPSSVSNYHGQRPLSLNTSTPAISSSSNQTSNILGPVHAEEIQVRPQRPLQSNQWSTSGTPFYKKANLQRGLGQCDSSKASTQSSFQKFVADSNSKDQSSRCYTKNSEKSSISRSYPTADSGGGGEVGSFQLQPDLEEVWKQARTKQMARVEAKKKQRIRPHPGSLYPKKQQMTRIKLHDLVDGQPPQTHSQQQLFTHGVLPDTFLVSAANAESFKFKGQDHFGKTAMATEDGILLGDGGRLVLCDSGTAGKEEFYHALLDTAGVDFKLVSCEWVYNHYRWIVWKLAAMEVAYPGMFAARFLTPNWVMLQLKYRYDREIDHSQRSALKKILERDDASSRRLVLCVSAIHSPGPNCAAPQIESNDKAENNNKQKTSLPTIELTDSWYAIKTAIDKPLATMIQKGRIFVGQKLCIYGAELVGSEDACSPLEVPSNLMLRISANSTRPARYDARLGLQCNPQPYPLSIASLYGEGGMVGCLDVVVVRCYPIQYMEKHAEGGASFRNSRTEEKEARKYSREKQQRMEKLFNKIQKDFEQKQAKKEPKRKTRSHSSHRLTEDMIQNLHTGQEIYEVLSEAYDPGYIEMHLSERQMLTLHNHQRSMQEKEQAELQAEFKKVLEEQEGEFKDRNVTPLLRVRLADYHPSKNDNRSQTCTMTVWRPTEDIMAYLTEGKRLRLYYVNVSPGRFHQGGESVQLASNKRTRYKELPAATDALNTVYPPRLPAPIRHVKHGDYEAVYGEVDIVGLVVSVAGGGCVRNSSSSLQTVYIADADADMIAIKFWGGLQVHCLEETLKPATFLSCSNLQYKGRDRYNVTPYLQATDTSSFTQTPKAQNIRQALSVLKNCIKDPQEFIRSIKDSTDHHAASMAHLPPVTASPTSVAAASPFMAANSSGDQDKCLIPVCTAAADASKCPVAGEYAPEVLALKISGGISGSNTSNQSVPYANHPHNISAKSKILVLTDTTGNTVSDARPRAKQFVPFSGVRGAVVSCTTKHFTPATGLKYVNRETGVQQNSAFIPNSGSASYAQKHLTPVICANSTNRELKHLTHEEGDTVGIGKPSSRVRSNLFGANSLKIDTATFNNASETAPISYNTPVRAQKSPHDVSLEVINYTPRSSSQNSQLEEKRKDISRRTRLLGRIPSPPPLSPLPSPMSGVVKRKFRPPKRYALRETSGSANVVETTKSGPNGQTSDSSVKSSHTLRYEKHIGRNQDVTPCKETGSTSKAEILPYITKDMSILHDKDRPSNDCLTPSQREVQELIGMPLSCLQELDMGWSQQTPIKDSLKVHADQKMSVPYVDLENQSNHIISLQCSELQNFNRDTESPPMDLSDLETEVVIQNQEPKPQEKTIISLPAICGIGLQPNEPTSLDVCVGSSVEKPKSMSTIINAEPKSEGLTTSNSTLTNIKDASANNRTPVNRGRRRVMKRPVNATENSSASDSNSKKSKRFCTHADLAVIDFESLDSAADMPNRRVTRSCKKY